MMRIALVLMLVFTMSPAWADEQQLGRDCDDIEKILLDISGGNYSRSWGVFQDFHEEAVYGGCVMTVTGNRKASPDFLSGFMRLQATADTELGKSGWTADQENDDADEKSFTINRQDNFCQVTGTWDEQDKSDPKSEPDPEFSIRVECGVKEE